MFCTLSQSGKSAFEKDKIILVYNNGYVNFLKFHIDRQKIQPQVPW